MKTNALVFPAPGKVELREIQLPSPTSRDIVVEVETSGVSVGTERWAYLGKRAELKFPNVPGYIGIGRIIEAGKDVKGYVVGDRVNFLASKVAGDLEGNSWMSSHLAHAVVDAGERPPQDPDQLDVHHCVKMPEGIDAFEAGMTNLGAVAMRGIEMAGIPAGTKVLVVGLGVIGQFAAQICRLKGAKVAVADIMPMRLEIARANGADWIIDSSKEKLAERAKEIAPKGFDIIIDTSSSPAVVNGLFPLLKMRGKFIFQGWYPPPSAMDFNAAHQRLPTCFFPCAHSDAAVAAVMQWTRDKQLKVQNLITHRPKPSEAAEIYRQIGAGSEGFLGVVFDWRKS
jgi:3-hydroxyethyl bacteriochlorophyllide a dehydrogenase